MTHPPITVIAYGSLMSGLGLSGLGHLPVIDAAPLRLINARRGFGKPSQYGDRYAMVLEPLDPQQPIAAAAVTADGIDVLALTVSINDLGRIAVREGYAAAAIHALAERAAAAGTSLTEHLSQMLVAADFDYASYRRLLFDAIGYTSPHYIPHPVNLSGAALALTFLAPGTEGSGSDAVVPVRVRAGVTQVLSLAEAWRLKPSDSQLDYFAMCLLAEAHQLSLADVLGEIDDTLRAMLRERMAGELALEPGRFCAVLGLAADAYAARFQRHTSSRVARGFANPDGRRSR